MNDDNPNRNNQFQSSDPGDSLFQPNDNTLFGEIQSLSTSLDGLSFDDAKEYTSTVLSIKKKYDKDIQYTEAEINSLLQKKETAVKKNLPDLATEVESKINELQNHLHTLKTEEMEVSVKLEQIMKELKNKKNQFQPSIDTNSLMEGLEKMIGKSSDDIQLEKETQQLNLQNKLDELKKKMNKEE